MTAMVTLLAHHHLQTIQLLTTALRQSLHQPIGCCVIIRCLLTSSHATMYHQHSCCQLLLPPIFDHFTQVISTSHHLPFAAPIVDWLFCCCPPLLPSFVITRHAVVQLSTLSLMPSFPLANYEIGYDNQDGRQRHKRGEAC
jgi:hypothetical protein